MKTLAGKEELFLIDAEGKRKGVLLDMKTYERLREAEEELADIRAYDSTRKRAHGEIAAGRFSTLAEYRAGRDTQVEMKFQVILPKSILKELNRLPDDM